MKKSILVLATAFAATSFCGMAAHADPLAHTFFPGHGDPQNFVVQNLTGTGSNEIQLGLEGQARGVGSPLPMSGDTYVAHPGGTGGNALWNFDFSIDTNPNGSSSVLLSDLTASIAITGPGGVNGTLSPLLLTDNNDITERGSTTLAQNSENLGFATYGALDNAHLAGFNPNTPGIYTFVLSVSGDGISGSDTINIDVVPLPASAWSGLALLGGLAVVGGMKCMRRGTV